MKPEDIKRSFVEVPQKIAEKLNKRTVDALRINTNFAKTLHEDGGEWAIANNVDIGIRAWLMFNMRDENLSPREALEAFMELLCGCILPRFLDDPLIRQYIEKEIKNENGKEATVLKQVNDIMAEAGMTPIIAAGSLQEIIEQLQGLQESESETKQ